MTSLYLVNPRHDHSDYDAAPGFVAMPDLAIVTIAAMAPAHWSVSVCEETITPVDLDSPARFVGITGKNAQLPRMIELAAAFRARGRTVLIGGPLASLDPDALRPHADILVTGEIEDIAPGMFADLEAGTWTKSYQGGRVDLRTSPVPRWDHYPVDRAMMGALQTTRGCPFECEFCDVIQYNGRKQRHKDLSQVTAELDALHAAGFRQVFLTDDNFTVHRKFARTMLDGIAAWNARHADDPIRFVTQASIDIARDPDLLERCVAAGLTHLFVGIETVNAASLRETRKRQNLLMPAAEAVNRIVSHGIMVRNGIMVGFDHDGPDIFDIQYEFLQSCPLPTPTVAVLNASPGTPLHDRMRAEGRLRSGGSGRWSEGLTCNFEPKQMSHAALVTGARAFARRVFSPAAFEQRLMHFISVFGTARTTDENAARVRSSGGARAAYAMSCLKKTSARGPAEAAMMSRVLSSGARNPASLRYVITSLVFYEQYQRYFEDVDVRSQLAA